MIRYRSFSDAYELENFCNRFLLKKEDIIQICYDPNINYHNYTIFYEEKEHLTFSENYNIINT